MKYIIIKASKKKGNTRKANHIAGFTHLNYVNLKALVHPLKA